MCFWNSIYPFEFEFCELTSFGHPSFYADYREDDPNHVDKPVVVDSVTLVDAMEEAEPKDAGLRFRIGESKYSINII